MDMLRVKNAGFRYQAENGEVEAFRNITFSVPQGQFLSIVGPSGCGKSTLLSLIAGLLPRTSGTVEIGGEEAKGISPHIGYMLQRDNLLEWRTIWDNVMFGLEIRQAISEQTIKRAEDLLRTYGLYEFRNKYPRQLSGGMRQRVALIRTLAAGPDILLLDEAFSALDFQTRLTVTDDVYRILKAEKVTMLMVTHDIPEAVAMGDAVLILSARPACVKEIYTIVFDEDRSPLSCRSDPRFSQYFSHIWKELREDEEIK
ncbi:MAG: ABC transporter ATP-binding protein [Clostridia bacterium]|nr:ABC transporter ATP-binding protein [Clostridia bacterium]MBQ7038564.1 ABC transporter ATP-binding protein [Clostridia bacterium]